MIFCKAALKQCEKCCINNFELETQIDEITAVFYV